MLAHVRHDAIIQKLNTEKSVKVSELMELFKVSFETIRRDLEYLEKEGHLQRVHGGAKLIESYDNNQELSFTVRELKYRDEKRELAMLATEWVSNGQSLILDVSTTNTTFAQVLKEKFDQLTILTNSFPIANELMEKPGFTVIFIGGVVRNQERCTIGDFAESFILQFNADLFFMSVSGISIEQGITDYGIGEVLLKKKMMGCAKETIVLADSSKFEVVSLLNVCPNEKVSRFVTDSRISSDIVKQYRDQGISLYY
ncbi:DeoR/GlpR family DNA-binding transcription regulator [Cohnella sp. WQ 127256]|uniref:DeoR/GlpR family DNA-binding transcription regulator n=1 Tax=Cohnella sp. WQ 127256 TaxID=2938790 RepID=UPI002119579E|nr:DeoR/GlpR family DNA-binding transcription regulator [Cohnella sp. WQ 127256]